MFYVRTYPRKGCVTAELKTGVGGGNLGKKKTPSAQKETPSEGPIWAICTKSGQKCTRIGGKKIHHTGILDNKLCIDTYYCIGQRLEL